MPESGLRFDLANEPVFFGEEKRRTVRNQTDKIFGVTATPDRGDARDSDGTSKILPTKSR
jgi:hypothetical protein